jgi:hypothetical protein
MFLVTASVITDFQWLYSLEDRQRLLSHWRNELHENGGLQLATFLVCNCHIAFHNTSPTDATATSVSATLAITVARDRASRFLGDQLRSRIATARWRLLRRYNDKRRFFVQHKICGGDRKISVRL